MTPHLLAVRCAPGQQPEPEYDLVLLAETLLLLVDGEELGVDPLYLLSPTIRFRPRPPLRFKVPLP